MFGSVVLKPLFAGGFYTDVAISQAREIGYNGKANKKKYIIKKPYNYDEKS